MKQIQKTHEQIGNPYKVEVLVLNRLPGIPGNDKEGIGNNNRKQLHQSMKKQVALSKAHRKNKHQNKKYVGGAVIVGNEIFDE
ncbi:hypothetical protein [Pedobacter sp. SYSU D00535]|uniref:hypothetical protein n=1 Tax=Pedobacter sp. SYSU D00535 TaxID=2810308 RepID=UPI00351BD0EE